MTLDAPHDISTELHQLSQFLTYRISRVHGKLNAQASKILQNSVGITLNQWRMIAFIGGGQDMTASELIRLTAMDKGLVSRNVKTLIELDLVTGSTHPSDSRITVLHLSPDGQRIFDQALPMMQRRQQHLQRDISAEDLTTFLKIVDLLEAAAEETTF